MRRFSILMSLFVLFALLASCENGQSSSLETGKNHKIQDGESLFSISQKAYGNGMEWPRLWEANPWLDPENLSPGKTIYIPVKGNTWGDPPPRTSVARNVGRHSVHARQSQNPESSRTSANPGAPPAATGATPSATKPSGGLPSGKVFHNFATQVRSKTVFGFPLEQTALLLFGVLMAHALVQSLFLWLAANLTFVKEASMKKATKAVFQTELLTFCTVVTFGAVVVVLLYMGKAGSRDSGHALFPALETPTGMAVAGGVLFVLYGLLCLRFVPTAFGLRRSRAMPLLFLAVGVPHVAAAYLIGQRLGWV